ncbi:MAG: histidine kinase [Propionibacteriaceae bacterium]|nr:histidine kinase [Propionibacteriaceae bacterium]
MAHDLHDTLGHEIALVSMSVGAAQVRVETDPAAAQDDLAQARRRLQKALEETQRVLAVLRGSGENRPAAGYDQILRLAAGFREAGMDVEAAVADQPAGLDHETGAAAYRIVQEGLTNARKHGAGAVRLQVAVTGGDIAIELVNRRRPQLAEPDRAGGFGLVGMRERAASAGGRVDVDSDDALFALRATLPVRGGGS